MEVWIRTRERKKIDWGGSYHENDVELRHPQKSKLLLRRLYKRLVNIYCLPRLLRH